MAIPSSAFFAVELVADPVIDAEQAVVVEHSPVMTFVETVPETVETK